MLITVDILVKAVHSGCALTGEKHQLEDCPRKKAFLLDAKHIWKYAQREAATHKE